MERSLHILVVDDAPLDRMRWGLLGRRHGITVDTAASAKEAMRSLQHDRPDIILMDLDMPGTDGIAAARILRDDPDLRHLPILCHSGSLRIHDAMATGLFDEELPKDLPDDVLVEGLRRHTAAHRGLVPA